MATKRVAALCGDSKYSMRKFMNIVEDATDNTAAIIVRQIVLNSMTAATINDGSCEDFADRVVSALGGPTDSIFSACPRDQIKMDRSDQTYDPTAPLHYFIIVNGTVFDAEAPHGVDCWQDLPFFKKRSW